MELIDLKNDVQSLILNCIKHRKVLKEPTLSLYNILKANGMETYSRLCARRIIDKELVDGCSIDYNINNPEDLLLSAKGIVTSKDILEGYCDHEKINSYINLLDDIGMIYAHVNHQVGMLRVMNIPTLFSLLKTNRQIEFDNYTVNIDKIIKAELRARLPHNLIKQRIKKLCSTIFMMWRYRKLYAFATKHFVINGNKREESNK